MAVEPPSDFDVMCDGCEKIEPFAVTEYCGQPESWGVDDTTLQEQGWGRRDGEIFCADCLKKEEE
jgi:hypothetical protein